MAQRRVQQTGQSRPQARPRQGAPTRRQAQQSQQRRQQRPQQRRQSVPQGKPTPQRQQARPRKQASAASFVPLVVATVIALALLVFVIVSVVSCVRGGASAGGASGGANGQAAPTPAKVSFCAVGDNLINEAGDYTADLLGLADAWEGTEGDGAYDFSPLYAQIKDTVSSYDIAFINQETTLGGNDEFDYEGYPSYNTPDEMAQAVADSGFDVVNCNTNHTYDTWTGSIEHAQKVWAAQKDVDVIGSYTSEEDREKIRVVDRNGMKIAFLSYCYGQNGYSQEDLPNDYYAVPFDKDKMATEVARAKKLADAVVVYMHWGEENTHELSSEQHEYAQYLADLGVDLTIGSHAHVIQPVAYITRNATATGEDAADEDTDEDEAADADETTGDEAADAGDDSQDKMLCVYGLGDFVSGYTLPKTILSGMFTCDFVRDDAGKVTVENPVWHGVVEHNEGDVDEVYLLSDYSDELAQRNTLLARVGENDEYTTSDPLEWAQQTTLDVVGDVIPVEV